MRISDQTTVGDLAAAVPASVRVFERHGLDFCCGGQKPLAAACNEVGVSVAELVTEIETAAATAGPADSEPDWRTEPIPRILDHIVAQYHRPLRADLALLQTLAAKVVAAHGKKSPVCQEIREIVDALATELLAHMQKEEGILFPAIRRLTAGQPIGLPLQAPIAVMEAEHEDAGALLRNLRTITHDYVPPDWACATVRALYTELERVEQEMHVHVHLENNVVFPRVVALVSAMH